MNKQPKYRGPRGHYDRPDRVVREPVPSWRIDINMVTGLKALAEKNNTSPSRQLEEILREKLQSDQQNTF